MSLLNKGFLVLGGAIIITGSLLIGISAGIDLGMTVYQAHCLACHGERGDGAGPDAMNYSPRPADFTSSSMYGVTDPMIEKAVMTGIPAVPSHTYASRLTNDEVAALIQYIRTFRK